MRAPQWLTIVTLSASLLIPSAASAADDATASLMVSARFASRTSLKVSAEVLHFDVEEPGQPATASVDFSAGARTGLGEEVLLSVEPVRAVGGPGGAADVESAVSFEGVGQGTVRGAVRSHVPTVAARWNGSGLRSGRLVFTMRAGARGHYSLPVRFVLSTP